MPNPIVAKIKRLHLEASKAVKASLKLEVELGRLLVAEKDKLRHGEFGKWIELNFDFSQRSANHYMNVYRHRDKLETVSNLREAIELAREKPKKATKVKYKIDADPQPKERCVELKLSEEEDAEFKELTGYLSEKVFRTKSQKATVLEALRFSKAHKDLLDD